MPKLPVCPYCHSVYRYGEVKKLAKYKKIQCRNCDKVFEVSAKKGCIIYMAVVCVVLMLINLIIFYTVQGVTIYHSLILTVVMLSAAILFLPYFVRFNKINSKENSSITSNKEQKKNNK